MRTLSARQAESDQVYQADAAPLDHLHLLSNFTCYMISHICNLCWLPLQLYYSLGINSKDFIIMRTKIYYMITVVALTYIFGASNHYTDAGTNMHALQTGVCPIQILKTNFWWSVFICVCACIVCVCVCVRAPMCVCMCVLTKSFLNHHEISLNHPPFLRYNHEQISANSSEYYCIIRTWERNLSQCCQITYNHVPVVLYL